MHHSVDLHITHGNVDRASHATTSWNKSLGRQALLRLIYGAGHQALTRSDATAQAGYKMMMMMTAKEVTAALM